MKSALKPITASLLAAIYMGAFCQAANAQQTNAQEASDGPIKTLGTVTVNSGPPSSLPSEIPTTMEGVSGEEVATRINATDSGDALKYLPSLLVRKRYIGDYNHAILSSRASGTGNSARSAVYADGILLSNFLGNGVGGLSFPPRWGMVTPEEIERVDVMYGPFSAAYPGNSVGAVVDYVTRMPTKFEGHAKAGYVSQPFSLYNTNTTFNSWQSSASLGNRNGDWSWFVNVNHTDSQGQPLTFPTRLLSNGVAGAGGTPVTGAVLDRNPNNAPIYVLGTGTQYHTIQDHAKVKVAYDLTSTVRATYLFGIWQNQSEGRPVSYLRDAAGQPVYSGPININGSAFTGSQALSGADFPLTNESLTHTMHGFSVKSHTKGVWDWEAAASLYQYKKDSKRQNAASNSLPTALAGGPGTIADGSGTGWNTLALKGIWRPTGISGPHIVDFGVQQDRYTLNYLTSNIAGNWISDGGGSLANQVGGDTMLRSLYAQDSWTFHPRWKTVLGARFENWTASNGFTSFGVGNPANAAYPKREENFISPKAALSWQWRQDTVLKASLGRAVRMPTVAELYGATSTTNSQFINDPNLRPETSWTSELTAEKTFSKSVLRLTFFSENTHDSLYSQTLFDPLANKNITRVQNVGRIQTNGLETAWNGYDVFKRGLDLSGSITYTDSVIKDNAGFVAVPGDTIGKQQPNIPKWRASALASYRFDEHWTGSLGARYSGTQYRTLNNSDVNGYTYMGVSRFFVMDLRLQYKVARQWTASFGIDNLNNYQYWNFHPYPQRSYFAELKFDM